LAPAPERFGPLKTKNHCINCTRRFPRKVCLWNRNTNFRLWPKITNVKLYCVVSPDAAVTTRLV